MLFRVKFIILFVKMSYLGKRARYTGVVSQSQDDGLGGGESMAMRRVFAKSRIRRSLGVARKSGIKAMISQAINRATETKVARYNFTGDLGYYNGTVWSATNQFPITPYTGYLSIIQGTGQADRIGNAIRPYRVTLTFSINPKSYDAAANPLPVPHNIRMLILKKKDVGTGTLLTTLPSLLQAGNTSLNPQSNMTDVVNSINTDLYTVYHDEVIKVGYAESNGTGGAAVTQYFANNDYKYCVLKKLDITKYYPKRVSFNDAGGIAQTSETGLYMAFLPCRADGSTPAAGNAQLPLAIWGNLEFKFKDA